MLLGLIRKLSARTLTNGLNTAVSSVNKRSVRKEAAGINILKLYNRIQKMPRNAKTSS